MSVAVFSADEKTVQITYQSQTWNLYRPVTSPWAYTPTGKTYWVGTNGFDGNPGTQASPFATISHAISIAQAGDLINVQAGTYVEPGTLTFTQSGTASSPIILSCAPGALGNVVVTLPQSYVQANTSAPIINVLGGLQNVWINGLLVQGYRDQTWAPAADHFAQNGITFQQNTSNCRVTNCVLYANEHCGTKVMDNAGTGILWEGNVIFANGIANSNLDHAIYCTTDSCTLNGNICFNNATWGLHLYHGSYSPVNLSVHRNICFGNGAGGILLACTSSQIYNNTCANSPSGTGILYFRSTCLNNLVKNNIFAFDGTDGGIDSGGALNSFPSGNTDDYNDYYPGTAPSGTGISIGTHEVHADPKFSSASTGDYRLLTGSPCIGAGTDLGFGTNLGALSPVPSPSVTYTLTFNFPQANGAITDRAAYTYPDQPSLTCTIASSTRQPVSGTLTITLNGQIAGTAPVLATNSSTTVPLSGVTPGTYNLVANFSDGAGGTTSASSSLTLGGMQTSLAMPGTTSIPQGTTGTVSASVASSFIGASGYYVGLGEIPQPLTFVGFSGKVSVLVPSTLGQAAINCAATVLTSIGNDYQNLQTLFGGSVSAPTATAILFAKQTNTDGTAGAYHLQLADTICYLDIAYQDPRICNALFVAEASEFFQWWQNPLGWPGTHADGSTMSGGSSISEGLSRWHAETLWPGIIEQLGVFPSAYVYLNLAPQSGVRTFTDGNGTFDFITSNYPSDTLATSYGAVLLWLYWMVGAPGAGGPPGGPKTAAAITQAAAATNKNVGTPAGIYQTLTGRTGALADWNAAVDAKWPNQVNPPVNPTNDNQWAGTPPPAPGPVPPQAAIPPVVASGSMTLAISQSGTLITTVNATLNNGTASFTIPSTLAAGNYTLTANYPGNGPYGPCSGTGSLSITGGPPPTPGGQVALLVDGVQTQTATLTSGSAGFTLPNLAAGTRNITVKYLGQNQFAPSSGTATIIVTGGPTGQVALFVDGIQTQTGTLDSSGNVPFSLGTTLTVGLHNLTASYLGANQFAPSSGTGTATVTGITTTTTISAPDVGYPTPVQATVTVAAQSGTASGNVTITPDGNSALAQAAALDATGKHTFGLPLGAGQHTLAANYPGSGGFLLSSGSTTVNVTGQATVTTVQPTNVTFPATATVTVSVTAGGQPVSNGLLVSLTYGGNSAGTAALSSGAATFNLSGLAAGSYPLVATFAAQGNYTGSSDASKTLTVQPASTSTAVTSTPATIVSPASATILVQVTASAAAIQAAGANPSGQVRLLVDGSLNQTLNLNSSASATFSVAGLSVATHTLVANYGGGGDFAPSSGSSAVIVAGSPTSTTITTATPTQVAGTVSITSGANAGPVASGTVNLLLDGSQSQVGTVANGSFTFSLGTLSPGSHAVEVDFPAQSNLAGSSDSRTVIVTGGTSLTISFAPTFTLPAPVQGTVTVVPGFVTSLVPTGTVTMTPDGNASLAQTRTLNTSAVASFSEPLAAGSHALSFSYSGDANFASGTGAKNVSVSAQPGVAVGVVANGVSYPSPALVAVTLTPPTGGPTPTGVVTATVLGPATNVSQQATLSGGIVPAFSFAGLNVGSYTATATYSGDANYTSSTSAAQSFQVTGSQTQTVINSLGATYPANLLATATVTSPSGGGTPSGMVALSIDGSALSAPLSPEPLDNNGNANFSIPTLAVGSHTLIATYQGAGQFASSTSPPFTATIAAASTTMSFPAPANIQYGQTVQATVTVSDGAAGTPGGNVSLQVVETGQSQTAMLANGVATFSIVNLTPGVYTLTATYLAQGNFGASSATTSVTVSGSQTSTVISVLPNPVVYPGQATATVTVSGNPAPAGLINLTVDGSALSPQQVSRVDATHSSTQFTLSGLSAGTHTLHADYQPSGNSAASSADATFQVVGTPTQITVAPASAVSGTGPNISLTVMASRGPVTGNVTASAAGVSGSGTLSGGSATITLPAVATAGIYPIAASYTGQDNFASSTGTGTLTITGIPTTATISVSDTPYGQAVPITVTVTPQSGSTPTGQVTIAVDGKPQPAQQLSGGTASVSISGLLPGTHTVTASYTPNTPWIATTATPATFNVTGAIGTTMVVTAPNTPFGKDEFVAVKVTPVSGPAVSGNLVYSLDGGSQAQVSFSGGQGTIRISGLTVGPHTIALDFPPQGIWAESTGSATFRITHGCGCAAFNSSAPWQVTPSVSQSCYWFKNIDPNHKIEVFYDSSGQQFKLVFSFPGLDQTNCPPAIYTVPQGNFKCCGMTTFAFASGGGGCGSLPQTVAIDTSGDCSCGTPPGCICGTCSQCGGTWPDHWLYSVGTPKIPASFTGACAQFNAANLVGMICQDKIDCHWTGRFASGASIDLNYVSQSAGASYWEATLTDTSGHTIHYRLAANLWNCCGVNSLAFHDNQSTCATFQLPANITLTAPNCNCKPTGNVACFPCSSLPQMVHLTFEQTGGQFDCGCLWNQVMPLIFNPTRNSYQGSLTLAPCPGLQVPPGACAVSVEWQCASGGGSVSFAITQNGTLCGGVVSTNLAGTCTPLNLTALIAWTDGCVLPNCCSNTAPVFYQIGVRIKL